MPCRFAHLAILPLLLALLLPVPCLAADSTAAPPPTSAAEAVPKAVLDPDMDEGHRQFAHANYEKALEHYLKALERNKEDAYLYFRIGLAYYMSGDLDNSHTYWLKSYEYDPGLPDKFASRIKSKSMLPTLLPEDVIITDDQYHKYKKLAYGNIIDFSIKEYDNKIFARRIIGLPGDDIEMVDNKIIRNGNFVNEDYIYTGNVENIKAVKNINKIKIPNNKYFVIGDNRNISYDSRHFGLIDRKNIFGIVIGVMERSPTESQRSDKRINE